MKHLFPALTMSTFNAIAAALLLYVIGSAVYHVAAHLASMFPQVLK